MLSDLMDRLGDKAAASLLGVHIQVMYCWYYRARKPTAAGHKAIWLCWALLFDPEALTSWESVVKWGRTPYRRNIPQPGQVIEPEKYRRRG